MSFRVFTRYLAAEVVRAHVLADWWRVSLNPFGLAGIQSSADSAPA